MRNDDRIILGITMGKSLNALYLHLVLLFFYVRIAIIVSGSQCVLQKV